MLISVLNQKGNRTESHVLYVHFQMHMHFELVFCMFLKNWVPEVVTPFCACNWSSYSFKVFSGSVLHSLCMRFLHLIKDVHITVGPQSLQLFVVKLLAVEITQTWVSMCCTLWGNNKSSWSKIFNIKHILHLFFFFSFCFSRASVESI